MSTGTLSFGLNEAAGGAVWFLAVPGGVEAGRYSAKIPIRAEFSLPDVIFEKKAQPYADF
ncbi:MAG: hypothetical protein L6Q77_12320 [Bacteroidetes bacterium]|nr:hypothetical protein [Bacteroidota bacterium]